MNDLKQQLQIIQDLMGQLQEKMEYGEDDFSSRLGRPKPEIQAVKIEGKLPMEGSPDEEAGETPDMEAMEGHDDPMGGMMDESPEDKLKKRLMALRA